MYVCQAALPSTRAVTDGLDGKLARLQDQGTGGMAPLATSRGSTGLAALCSCGQSPRLRREPGAAVARQGLRAAARRPGACQGPHGAQPVTDSRCAALGTVLSSYGAFAYAVASPLGALGAPLKIRGESGHGIREGTFEKGHSRRDIRKGRLCCPAVLSRRSKKQSRKPGRRSTNRSRTPLSASRLLSRTLWFQRHRHRRPESERRLPPLPSP
jgi:hypothetical protein